MAWTGIVPGIEGKDDFDNIVLPVNNLDIFHGIFEDEGQSECN